MIDLNLISAFVLIAIFALLASLYATRVLTRGRARFDRVEREGGSWLLSKRAMEMVYWSLDPLARTLVWAGVTANQLTWMGAILSFAAAACLALGHFGSAALIVAFSGLMDCLDGMVARLTQTDGAGGKILDSSMDRYAEFLFISGAILYYREYPWVQAVALAALLGAFMVSYSTAKAEIAQAEVPRGSMRRGERAVYLTLGALLSSMTIPAFEAVRQGPAIAHPMVLALVLVAVFANISAIERLVAVARAEDSRNRKRSRSEHADLEKAGSQVRPLRIR